MAKGNAGVNAGHCEELEAPVHHRTQLWGSKNSRLVAPEEIGESAKRSRKELAPRNADSGTVYPQSIIIGYLCYDSSVSSPDAAH